MSDIRIRTLRELTSILKNNILFANKDPRGGNEEISVVSLETLVRHLIQWFQFRPVLYEDEVLDLLILILSVSCHSFYIQCNVQFKFCKILATRLSEECR